MAKDDIKKSDTGQVPIEETAEKQTSDHVGPPASDKDAQDKQVINLAFDDKTDPGLEPPPPFDIPNPGEVVVNINEIKSIGGEDKTASAKNEKAPGIPGQSNSPEKSDAADDALRMEQEALLKASDEKADAVKPAKSAKKAPVEQADTKDKPAKEAAADKPMQEKQTRRPRMPGETKTAADKEPAAVPAPEPPRDAPRSNQTEQIVFINHAELFPFKDHPFQVRNDEAMKTLVESVKERGVDQPAIVRPREGGGYELIAGHRRQKASELAGYTNVPCVVRNLTDDEAVLAMTESNFNQRSEILPSERAKALQMQLEAIKHQGARFMSTATNDIGKRSNEIVAERNQMKLTTVKRYISLNKLTPELMKMVDDKKIAFTPAVELSYIKPKGQKYVAIAIEGQQSAPSLAQAQRMRDLDQKGLLNPDVIDGIMLEEKKGVDDKVIISSQELGQYFGKEVTPREMKDQILKLLDDWKGQNKDIPKPEKQKQPEK